ncbi:MAG: acyl-CoA thioesterase [Planctomycetota bacterium]
MTQKNRKDAQPAGRPVTDSQTEMTEIVFPNDANPLGNVMGGRVMHWIDICAAICAGRHARTPVVTAAVDQIDFHRPVRVGGVLSIKASVNYAHRTSMEIGVKMWNEDRATGERSHVASAYLTFVSLDPSTGTPRPVSPVIPATPDEERRYRQALERRQRRLEHRRADGAPE